MATTDRKLVSKTWRWRFAQWLEIRWWKQYLAQKDPQAYRAQKIDYWSRLCLALDVNIPLEASVLDAGCGPAGIFLCFPDHQVDALDPLLDAYESDLPHFEPDLHPNTTFLSQPLEALTAKAKYDWVCCLNAINHVSDWEACLDILSASAKTNGKLLLGIDVHNHTFLKRIFQAIPGDVLHPHQHDREDYHAALNKRGWQITKAHTWKESFLFDYWLVVAERE